MNCTEVLTYISAVVDKDFSAIPGSLCREIERSIRNCPHCAQEYDLEQATKRFLEHHASDIRCPKGTVEMIQAVLYHLYRSAQLPSRAL